MKAITGSDSVNIFGKPHPLKDHTVQATATAGQDLKTILGDVNPHCLVIHNGEIIDHGDLSDVVAEKGDTINLAMQVSGGGDKGDKVLMTVLQVAVIAASLAVPALAGLSYGTLSFAAASAAIQVGGNLMINALVPEPSMETGSGDGEEFKRLGGLTGTRNQMAPYGPVPKVYGKHRIYPLMSAKPFTEVQSNVQYLHLLFCVGHGPVSLSNPKIGDTVIGSFDSNNVFTSNDNFEKIKVDVAEQPDYYTNDVDQNDVSVTMNDENVATRTTAPDTNEAGIDFIFPRGLFGVNADGDVIEESVGFKIEYRESGTSDPWINPFESTEAYTETNRFGREDRSTRTYPYVVFESDEKKTLRDGVTIEFDTPGQYDIRVERVSAAIDPEEGASITDCTWTALKSVTYEDPIDLPGVVHIGMRIKATDQLNGVLDNFSVEVETRLATYDTGTDSWDVPTFDPNTGTGTGGALTSNPAWVYADVLAGNANPRPIPRSKLDGLTLADWADYCVQEGFHYNSPGDAQTTIFELARNVCSIARASWGIKDGKFTVIQDRQKTVPTQVFTPRNSWDFSGELVFPDVPDALKIRFTDPNNGWQENERIVYSEGQTAETATDFRALSFPGVTDSDHAWKLGRYFLAAMKLRPSSYSLNADVEHIVCQRGDLVKVNHDVPQWGLQSGRLKSVTTNVDGDVTQVTVDQPVVMEAGQDYVVAVRTDQDRSVVQNVDTLAGQQTTLTLTDPIPAAKNVTKGDLFMFGKLNQQSVDLKVKNITPREDLAAELTLINAAPEIEQAGVLPVQFTPSDVDPSTERFNISDHGLYDQDEVQFTTTDTLPSPLTAGTTYYVINRTTDHFQVSETKGGSAVNLTDSGVGDHTATRQIPDWDPQISEPVDLENLTPPPPTIEGIRSDETTLTRDDDGSYSLKMIVSFDLAKGLPAAQVEARVRRQGVPGAWVTSAMTEASNGVIEIPGVQPGDSYIVQLRTVAQNNVSDWVEGGPHSIDGKLGPPADVTGFTAELDQVIIRLNWDKVSDSDLKEYEIRKGSDWASGTTVKTVDATETTLKVTTTGTQAYWIKAVDTSGNYSGSATQTTVDVPSDWLDDVARVGGEALFNNLSLNDANPYLDLIESDVADKNWRMVPKSGDLHIQERDDGDNIVATAVKVKAGAPNDSLVVASSGQLQVPDLAVGGTQIFNSGQEQNLGKDQSVNFDQVILGSQATTTGQAVRADRSLTIQGTTEQIAVSGGTQDLTGNRTWTISLPDPLTTPGDLNVSGTINYVNEENLQVEDKTITVNKNGTDGSAEGAGLILERPSGNRSMLWNSTSGFNFNDRIHATVGVGTSGLDDVANGRHVGVFERSGDSRILIGSDDTGISAINFGDTTSFNQGEMIYDHSADTLSFRINGTIDAFKLNSDATFDFKNGGKIGGHLNITAGGSAIKGATYLQGDDVYASVFLRDNKSDSNTQRTGMLARREPSSSDYMQVFRVYSDANNDVLYFGDSVSGYSDPTRMEFTITNSVGTRGNEPMWIMNWSGITQKRGVFGSRDYQSGIFGGGYILDQDASGGAFLEIDNARIRGTLRSHIFKKDIVKASNAFLYISDAGELVSTATTPSTVGSTFEIHVKEAVFDAGDDIEFKDEDLSSGGSNIYRVTATVDSYDSTNSTANDHIYNLTLNSGTDIPLEAGDTFVRTSGGAILNDASSQYSPFMDVLLDQDTKVRLGNVRGISALSLSSDTWGLYAKDNIFLDFGASDIFKIGKNAGGSGKHGIFVDSNDYWFGSGLFSLGSGILKYSGTDGDPVEISAWKADADKLSGNDINIGQNLNFDENGKIQLGHFSSTTFKGMQIKRSTNPNTKIDIGLTGGEPFIRYYTQDTTTGTTEGSFGYDTRNDDFGIRIRDNGDELFEIKESKKYISSWNFNTKRFFNNNIFIGDAVEEVRGAGRLLVGRRNGNPHVWIEKDPGNDWVRMWYSGTTDWGIEGALGGNSIFELGSTNQIAGWAFNDTSLRKTINGVELAIGTPENWSQVTGFHAGYDANNRTWIGEANGTYELSVQRNGQYDLKFTDTEFYIGNDVNIYGNLSVNSIPVISDEGLEGLWRLDGSPVNGITGERPIFNGNPDFVTGVSGQGIDFSTDSTAYIEGETNHTIGTGDFSVVFTINPNLTDTGHPFTIGKRGEASEDRVTLWVRDSGDIVTALINDAGSESHNLADFASAGQRYTIVVEREGGTVYVYVNGILEGQFTSTRDIQNANKFIIGRRDDYQQDAFKGLIDEVYFFSRAISEREIKALQANPSGTSGGIISANMVQTGRLESTNLDRGSGTFTNTGTLFDLDQGDIIAEDFSIIGGTATFKGNLSSPSGDIGGFQIYNGRIEANGQNQAFIHMISGDKPEFHFRAQNGEDLHIGGDFSFDNEEDINVSQGDFTPSLVDVSDDDTGNWSDNDTHTYHFSSPGSLEGRNLRFTTTQSISATVINIGGESQSASASCNLKFRLIDSTGSIISGYEWSDSDNVSTSDGVVSGAASLTISVEIPSGVDFSGIEVYWSLSVSTSGSNTTADASMDVDSPPAFVVGTAEFISPLGLQFTNEESTQTVKPRVKLERNTGQGLVHELIIEGPNGRQAKLVMNGSNLELQDVHGSTVRDSWSMTAP